MNDAPPPITKITQIRTTSETQSENMLGGMLLDFQLEVLLSYEIMKFLVDKKHKKYVFCDKKHYLDEVNWKQYC